MGFDLSLLSEQLSKRHPFEVYKKQINKDLERSGFAAIQSNDPKSFLEEVAQLLTEAMEDSDPKLQQLYYLADVQERHLKHGIILGFFYREWVKVKFRLNHQ